MRSLFSSLLLLSASLRPCIALGPWHHFQTEPDFRSSIFNITVNSNPELLSPGYIFLTTYVSDFKVGSFGPQIYDMNGMLIWNGNESAYVRAMDAHVCDYLGEKRSHICMNDAAPVEQAGHSAGLIRFFDNTYTQAGSDHGAAGMLRGPDIHELNTPDGDDGYTLLQDIYQKKSMDLRPYLGEENGYVLDACFQEIDLRTKGVNFQWCMLDHVEIWDTYLYLHIPKTPGKNDSMPIGGNGTWNSPWDFAHINAVGKNLEGDYIISARHLDTIFKIAGKNNNLGKAEGDVLWRLGGKRNDFKMMDGLNFSRQHTVRFVSTGKTESTISLFNNAFDGWFYTAKSSSGQLISINNETMEARLLESYLPVEPGRSFSQGSMQILPEGNVFMGWGNRAFVSEHTSDGTPLYWAWFSGAVESFRAWKFPWKGYPKTKPKLISYAFNSTSPLYAYVSWNGATEVKSWRVYYSDTTRYGPWYTAGKVQKHDFETMINFTSLNANVTVPYHAYVYADAIDKNGKFLMSSNVFTTFVPKQDVKKDFNATMCTRNWYKYPEKESEAHLLPRNYTLGIFILAFLVCTLESLQWVMQTLLGYSSYPRRRRRRGGHLNGNGNGSGRLGSWDEKMHHLRPPMKHAASGPSSPIVIVNGMAGTGFSTKVSGVEV